jgi:hypothetical protein
MFQPLVFPQLGLHPTQVLGHITGEACDFLLREERAKGVRNGGGALNLGRIHFQKETPSYPRAHTWTWLRASTRSL